MPLIKANGITDDLWTFVKDEEQLPPEGAIIVTLARWQANRDQLAARPTPLGIRLKSDQAPSTISGDIERFDVIALEFPKFTDGRAYSSARLLRERHGFRGELRAVGNVLRDQLAFMRRCGFDSYEIPEAADAAAWAGSLRGISVVYQPATDQRQTALAARHRPASAPRREVAEEEEPAPKVIAAAVEASNEYSQVCAGYWAY
ncbi:MAG TPA: DUF934 domain-containing protein [Verrucomicrobiae bacterium]|jgi:uncharacterized protein (DUF934 family)|nr:DUF934 domain-containing protein [Verrucomicrobiae bacterium]